MLKAKLSAVAASSALVLSLLTPAAFADTNVDISGNGVGSTNTSEVKNKDKTVVEQTNSTVVGITIASSAKTGGNKANGNTGDGDVTVDTGDATSTVGVEVSGSSNELTLPDCGCAAATDTVTISGNGKDSTNTSTVKNKKKKVTKQTNGTVVGATIASKAKTGKNKANNNTGSGNVEVKTGDSTSDVMVAVDAPSNVATP